jgi:hypothetical protein
MYSFRGDFPARNASHSDAGGCPAWSMRPPNDYNSFPRSHSVPCPQCFYSDAGVAPAGAFGIRRPEL